MRRIAAIVAVSALIVSASCRDAPITTVAPATPPATDAGDATAPPDASAAEAGSGALDLTYFKAIYAADTANHEYQTEDEYCRWVREFYDAKATLFTPMGWRQQSDELLAKIQAGDARSEIDLQLQRLGKRIASEWAKDRRASKLEPINDLATWGGKLREAAESDDGTGATILPVLAAIEEEVTARLGAE